MRKKRFALLSATTALDEQTCHNCRFGGVYECRKHAPVYVEGKFDGQFPSIYNAGLGTWCGDWEPRK